MQVDVAFGCSIASQGPVIGSRLQTALADDGLRPGEVVKSRCSKSLRPLPPNGGSATTCFKPAKRRIESFLAESHAEVAGAELARLTLAHGRAHTADAQQKFADALSNKQSELKSREALQADSEGITAELAELQSAIESSIISLGEILVTIEALEQALLEVNDPTQRRLLRRSR